MRYDYGDPRRGDCYEYLNFADTLRRMPELEYHEYLFDTRLRDCGRTRMNRELVETASALQPAVCLFVLFTDEIARETLEAIRKRTRAVTANWFGDDHWRFLPYSRRWARHVDWVITTDHAAAERYRAMGCRQVIQSQWGFNHHMKPGKTVREDRDVTFVGQAYAARRLMMKGLAEHNTAVECWGYGWTNGRLKRNDTLTMYRRSRINLNFTESSITAGGKRFVKVVFSRRADGAVRVNSPGVMVDFARTLRDSRSPQIKGRNFEIPGAGGFLLTSSAPGLEKYFVPGKEIVVFDSLSDCADQIRFYLAHPQEREKIRRAGHQRALRDHTYERRLHDVTATMLRNAAH